MDDNMERSLEQITTLFDSQMLAVVETSEKTHPHLKGFSKAPTTAFICVAMKRYFMVNQFQNVIEIQVKS